jgi:hypothetical protein
MNWRTLRPALIGFVWGVALATTITVHLFTGQIAKMADQQLSDAGLNRDAQGKVAAAAQGAVDAWKHRAEVCEDRFAGATVIYEYRPAVSLPIIHGLATLSLGSGSDPMGGTALPAWWIPGKVKVYTNQPGASYSWIAGDGSVAGQWAATPPPQEQPQ